MFFVRCLSAQDSAATAQQFADKSHYLVDSLILGDLKTQDQELLELSLPLYHKATSDTSKIAILENITENMIHEDWKKYNRLLKSSSLIVFDESKKFSPAEKNKLLGFYAAAINNEGYALMENGNVLPAIEKFEESLKILRDVGREDETAGCYNNLGICAERMGNAQKAMEYYHQCLLINQKFNNKKGEALALGNLAILYMDQGDRERGLEYNRKSLKIREEIDDKAGIVQALHNIGSIYRITEHYDSALIYFNKSIAIREQMGLYRGLYSAYLNLGGIYEKQGDTAKAYEYYYQGLELTNKLKNDRGRSATMVYIAFLKLAEGKVEEAEKIGLSSYDIAKSLNIPHSVKTSAQLLSNVYEKKGAGIKALEYYKEFIEMRDSLRNEETQNEIMKQGLIIEYEAKERELKVREENRIALDRAEDRIKNLILLGVIISLIAAVVLLFVIINRFKLAKEKKILVEEAYEELNQTNEEILAQRDQIEHQKKETELKNNELFNKNVQISDSINYAKRLQTAILADESELHKHLEDCFVFYRPKDIVSGDFYWIHKQWDLVYFAVVDCTGHGVPGALMSLVCNRILNATLDEFKFEDPGMILSNAHTRIIEELGQEVDGYMIRDGMDISLCIYDEEEKELRFAGAHNSAVHISNGKITRLEADNRSVGFSFKKEKQRDFTTHTISILEGDMLYLFTDGYTDQFGGEKGQKFFYQNLENILARICKLPLSEQNQIIQNEFDQWKGNQEQIDDVTVMGVRF